MDARSELRDRIEAIIRKGKDVQRGIAAAVARAATVGLETFGGATDVVAATVRGASESLAEALPADRDRTLRQVVDGIGDGLAMAAHAAELTLREARDDAGKFVREDVARVARAFDELPRDFVKNVTESVRIAARHGASEVKALEQHAQATCRRVAPAFASAVAAARENPLGLAGDALGAGIAAARGASGALFTVLGEKLASLGSRIDPRRKPSP